VRVEAPAQLEKLDLWPVGVEMGECCRFKRSGRSAELVVGVVNWNSIAGVVEWERSGSRAAERKRKSDFRRDVLPLAAETGDKHFTYTPLLPLDIT
jgi:hypothetical protein